MEVWTRGDLLSQGLTDRRIAAAIDRGILIRLRPGLFATSAADEQTIAAAGIGARVACVSALRSREIWVQEPARLHVEVGRSASRLPAAGFHVHWRRNPSPDPGGDRVRTGVTAALIQASGCLSPIMWIAAVDSALHQGAISSGDLAALAARASPRSRRFVPLVDRRAESGLESIVRVVARELGFHVRSQVRIDGVGRVDLVVERWIAVETDGAAFHGVSLSARDRLRDARLAARGMTALRPGYSLVVFDRRAVAEQLIGAVGAHRRVNDAGHLAARARRRLARLDLS
ncbi:MAG TPA: hypothetical protein VGM70_11490 [Pseudolysinimonas sp.]|jgi:very-short-patch-repair endonuclease